MKIINIKVTDKLKVTGIVNGDNTSNSNIPVKIASGNYKSIILNFEFDNTIWDDNLEKYATFSVENQEGIQVKLEQIDKYQNACYVPFSVLKQNCKINVGAYGTFSNDDNVEKIISTENLYFLVVDGSFSQYLVDETPVDIEKIKLLKDEIISEIDNYSKEKQGNYDENAKTKLSAYNKNCEEKLKNYNDNTIAKIEEYNSNADQKIDEYNENADDLIKLTTSTSNELYRLKTDVLETGMAKDSNIHLEDSALSEMQEISVDGVCEQKTTMGKNSLDYDNLTNIGQLTKINPYGFRITGTNAWMSRNFTIDLKANTKYTFKCLFNQIDEMSTIEVSIREENGKIIKDLISSNKNGTLIGSFTTEAVTKITFHLYSNLSATPMTTTCDFTFLQIVEGEYTDETMPDFEPYTGCQPSPSPNYSQNISVLIGNLKLTSAKKNLLDYVSNLITSNNGLTSVINDDGSITTIGKPTSNYSTITKTIDITDILEDKSTYTISQSVPANLFVQINLRKSDGTLKYANSNRGSSSFIVDKSIYSSYTLIIQTTSMETWGDSPLTITNKYMLCKGTDTANTSFEPYQDSSLNIAIPSNEFVGKLDDTYKDTLNVIYKDDGHYHLILNKMIGKVLLDGSEEYTNSGVLSNNYIYMMKTIINDIKSAVNDDEFVPVMSNYFSNGFSYRSLGNSIAGTNGIVIAQNNTLTVCHSNYTKENIKGFKSWLSTHNTEVYYPLKTPYEVDLGIVDQLLTFDEITNIFTDSDLYPVINIKYYRNFITTIKNLQINNKALKQELVDINNRLAALESANTSVVDNNPTEESEVTE